MSHQGPKMDEEQKLLARVLVRADAEFHAYPLNISKVLNRPSIPVKDLPWVRPTMSSTVRVDREGFMQAMHEVWGQEFVSLLLEMEET